jgi:hypothetical protein
LPGAGKGGNRERLINGSEVPVRQEEEVESVAQHSCYRAVNWTWEYAKET